MTYTSIEEWIRTEHGHHASFEDQLYTARWFHRTEITEVHARSRRTAQIEETLEAFLAHEVRRVLENLADIDVLEKIEPASRSFILNERTSETFWSPEGEGFQASLYDEMSRMLCDIHVREGNEATGRYPDPLQPPVLQTTLADGGDPPINPHAMGDLRGFVASELGVSPEKVGETLVEPVDVVDRMERFEDLVRALIDAEDAGELERGLEYGPIGWRNQANRWALSGEAKAVEDNDSIIR